MNGAVTISENGRDGTVRFSRGLRTLDGYWSFGGGDIVAIVSMGSREEWQRQHAWALADRGAILRFVAAEVVRQRAPTCTAEIDEASGDVLLRESARSTAHAAGVSSAQASAAGAATAFIRKYSRVRSAFALAVLAATLAGGALLWGGKQLFTVAPANGVPLNDALRTEQHVAALIQYTDPHLPEITGRGGNTTTSVSVLLIPLDGSEPNNVPLVSGVSSSALALARIVGSDGRTLWLDAAGFYGVRLADNRLVTANDLRTANSQWESWWWDDPRGMDIIDGKLHLVSDDRRRALELDPVTWRATSVAPKVNNARFARHEPLDLLAAGFRMQDGRWFGVYSSDELTRDVAPGTWLRRVESATDAKQMRRLYVGETEASSDQQNYRLQRIAPLGEREFLNAALLRLERQGDPLQLADPASVLMLFTSAPGLEGTLVVARVDFSGSILWATDTGLDRFDVQQILPGVETLAFVGVRPPIPDKLSEPLVVLLDAATGKLTTHSLWRKL